MPKKEKRVYTYDQLDAILRRRGEKHPKLLGLWMARLYGNVYVSTTHTGAGLSIRYVGSDRTPGFMPATVYKIAGGDTMYRVSGVDKDSRKDKRRRALYRDVVHRFTPRVIVGRVPADSEWFRIHDGVARPMPAPKEVRNVPVNCSLAYASVTRPSCKEWLAEHQTHHPKLCGRARSFYVRLRKALQDGLPCTVQLVRPLEVPIWARRSSSPTLHVCLPPSEREPSRRLFVAVSNHDLYSRRHFGVDGDFGHRHAQVIGMTPKGVSGWEELRWKSTRDAIVGVKEWVMNSVYIPGF